jgi:hypothetical protein
LKKIVKWSIVSCILLLGAYVGYFFYSSPSSPSAMRLDGGKFTVEYTDSLIPDSEVVLIDETGKVTSRRRFSVQGASQIIPDGEGGYLFPADCSSFRAHIDKNGKLSIGDYHLHTDVRVKNGVQVNLYNTDLRTNTVELIKGKVVKKYTVPSLTGAAFIDDKYIYVTCSGPNTESCVYVYSMQDLNFVRKILVPHSALDNIDLFQGKLILPDGHEEIRTVSLLDTTTWKVQQISLPYPGTEMVMADKDAFYLTTGDAHILKLDAQFHVVQTTQDLQPDFAKRKEHNIVALQVDQNYLYTLSQLNDGHPYPHAGYISYYDKKTLKLQKRIFLPVIRETLVRDFILREK